MSHDAKPVLVDSDTAKPPKSAGGALEDPPAGMRAAEKAVWYAVAKEWEHVLSYQDRQHVELYCRMKVRYHALLKSKSRDMRHQIQVDRLEQRLMDMQKQMSASPKQRRTAQKDGRGVPKPAKRAESRFLPTRR